MINIENIRIDGGTQIRVEPNQETIDSYAVLYSEGYEFPPITVFFDGIDYWLADGFHRYFAAKKASRSEIKETIINGTKRDAILFSVGANGSHGLNRTNADKRNAVETLLADGEWVKWSDREIAKAACVSVPLVGAIRRPEVKEKQKHNRVVSAARQSEKCNPITPEISNQKPNSSDSDAEVPEYNKANIEEELYGDFDPMTELESANKEKDVLRKEIERLNKIIDADDRLSILNVEIKRLKDLNQVLESQKNGYLISLNDQKNSTKHWKLKFEKLEKQVKASGLVEF